MGKTVKASRNDTIDLLATYEQFNAALTILPDKTRILMKVLGPLMTTYMQIDMALQSVNKTFRDSKKPVDELGESMGETGEEAEERTTMMGIAVSALSLPFKALGGAVKVVGGLFKKLLLGILPLMGIMMGIAGIVMIAVAAFDKGGGSLKSWLEDLPIVGGMMEHITTTIEKVKVLWETLKANITLPEGTDSESFMTQIVDGLTFVVDVFIGYWTMIADMVFTLITALAEAGIFQAILDGFMTIMGAFIDAYAMISDALGGDLFTTFFDTITNLWTFLIDFLVTSGVFDFIGELISMIAEIVGVIVFLSAIIITVVIKIIMFVYPYVKPYYMMLFNAIGFFITYIMMVVRIFMGIVRIVMALLTGNTDKAKEIFWDLIDSVKASLMSMWGFAKGFVNQFINLVWPLFALINKGIDLIAEVPGMGWVGGLHMDKPQFAKGGIASGPKSGYEAILHGTEAVIPMPDGKTIPVTLSGGEGGGGSTTININVSGANGDPRKIARMVGDEVGRLFKNRSRSGGFSRGV